MRFRALIFLKILAVSQIFAQSWDEHSVDDLLILPRYRYGPVYLESTLQNDSTYVIQIKSVSDNVVFASGDAKTLSPLILDGKFKFYTPSGKPYAQGYYSDNRPYWIWTFFDDEGQVRKTINYSHVWKLLESKDILKLKGSMGHEVDHTPECNGKDIHSVISSLVDQAEYPPLAMIMDNQEHVFGSFVINRDGLLTNPYLMSESSIEFTIEFYRLLFMLSDWTPAIKNGEAVNFYFYYSLDYVLEENFREWSHPPQVLIDHPNSFEHISGNFYRIYYDYGGYLIKKKRCDFYREGEINPYSNMLEGPVIDYSPKGIKIFEGSVYNGQLKGEFKSYDKKGRLISEGNYLHGDRIGRWNLYHHNGQLKARLIAGKVIYLEAYYTKDGVQTVRNGQGEVKWHGINTLYRGFSGKIKDGKRVGVWENGAMKEAYTEQGKFLYSYDKTRGVERDVPAFSYFEPVISEDIFVSYVILK